MRWLAGLLSGIMAALLPACDGINLAKLRPGYSTMAEVREIMGPPTQEWADSDGSASWEYPRTPEGIVNYMIDFGPDQKLREVRQVLTDENFAKVREGMSREQIRRLLGRPAHERHFSLTKEHVWDWKTRSEGSTEYFFNVHFDEQGRVVRTSTNFESRN